MSAPANHAEYLERYHRGEYVTGYGLETTVHSPCPFCAAPDFISYKVLEVEPTMAAGATCKECGRSMRAIFTRSENGVRFEIVQTGGPDQADWQLPKMRRVDQ